MNETAHASRRARRQGITRALHVRALEVLAPAPVAEHRRRVKRELAAGGGGPHRLDIGQIATDRPATALADPRRGLIRSGEATNRMPIGDQPLDQATANEPRATRDEHSAHRLSLSQPPARDPDDISANRSRTRWHSLSANRRCGAPVPRGAAVDQPPAVNRVALVVVVSAGGDIPRPVDASSSRGWTAGAGWRFQLLSLAVAIEPGGRN